MKKLILSIVLLLVFSSVMIAQDEVYTAKDSVSQDSGTEPLRSNVWKRTRFVNVSYVTQDLEAPDAGAKW